MGGFGYGIPFAILHPSHGDAILSYIFNPESKTHGMELDFDNLVLSLIVWTVVNFFVLTLYKKYKNRKVRKEVDV